MNHQRERIPSYRFHKASGQAIVTLDGRDHYLGAHESDESRAKYRRLIRRYLADGRTPNTVSTSHEYRIAELCRDCLDFAERTYRDLDGNLTTTPMSVRYGLRALFEFAADVEVEAFGPRMLTELRDSLASSGLSRTTVNDRLGVIRRAFKWAVAEERVGPSVCHAISTVGGLRRGRSAAREPDPVRPVPEEDIRTALPFMPPTVRAMVELQLLTGARPGEIVLLRAYEIDRTGKVWVFSPSRHKSTWREHHREVYLGPRAQSILATWLRRAAPDAYVFSPRESERMRREALHARRKTPLWPSHLASQARRKDARSRQRLADRYDVTTYRRSITRACQRARVAPWSPNRLRHNSATQLRREYGRDVAKAVLGHRLVETTQIYAEVDRKRAMDTIGEVG